MKQKFFITTIQSKFIQNLITSIYLPIYDTIREGDYIVSGFNYIDKNSIIQCTSSGYFGQTAKQTVNTNKYVWGNKYDKITQKYKSNTSYYSTDLHEYLGEYLRNYRDIHDINLMPFYNCFSGRYTSKFRLEDDVYSYTVGTGNEAVVNNVNKKTIYQNSYDVYAQGSAAFNDKYITKEPYKVIQIPIKFNKKYTIAIDCDSEVSIAPAFIANGRLINPIIGGSQRNLTEMLINNVYDNIPHIQSKELNSTSFKQPFVYEVENKNTTLLDGIFDNPNLRMTQEQLLQRYQKYLYLLIQIPQSNTSSIVVLEGDYTNLRCDEIFDISSVKGSYKGAFRNLDGNMIMDISELPENKLDEMLLSDLSLLSLSDEIRYPFANRLLEYLLYNTIDSMSIVGNDIYRTQLDIMSNINMVSQKGAWSDSLRYMVYNFCKRIRNLQHLDLNGFVDKNSEYMLNKR